MHSKHHEDLARISAESRAQLAAAEASRADAASHIRSSREAIARSFRSLALPFLRISD